MNQLLLLYSMIRRGKKEPAQISAMIENEGGDVLEFRHVSRLKHSPFKNVRIHPMLYEFRVQYGIRKGHWYVRTSGDNGDYEWAWMDGDGYETLPVARNNACLIADAQPVGLLIDSFVVIGVITLGVLGGIAAILVFS
jgi:hypothetical protein